MGLFNRFLPKSSGGANPAARKPPETPAPAPSVEPAAAGSLPRPEVAPESASGAVAGGVLARLAQAREALELRNLEGARAIYEEVLAAAGDRADVLVTISGDLGVTGHTREIIELIAPRYDAQRHGPATGFNLLQAYMADRDPQAAQHVLDLLFALNRPELEERLFGFSNAVADMMLLQEDGAVAPVTSDEAATGEETPRVDLVTISKPIWYYGLESLPGLLPPKEGKLRRIAIGQLAVLGVKEPDALVRQPEEELGRLSRGIPLWLAETLHYSVNYASVMVAAVQSRRHYALFNAGLTPEHIRQLVEHTEGGLDYVLVGTLEQKHSDYELVLRVWEVKKFRERKAFRVRWTPATADEVLGQLHAQICAFMEFTPYPAGQGLAYGPPARGRDYVEALGAGLTLFLGEKQVLPREQMVLPPDLGQRAERAGEQSEAAALLALGLRARARDLGLTVPPASERLVATPAVAGARQTLKL